MRNIDGRYDFKIINIYKCNIKCIKKNVSICKGVSFDRLI